MMPRLPALPLRTRVTLLYTLLGMVMSLLFAGLVTFIGEDYEHVLVEEILRSQADDYARQLQAHPDIPVALPHSARLDGYLRRSDGSGIVPAAIAALPPGIHDSPDEDTDGLHVAVFDTAVGRMFFSINLMDIERLERHMRLILIGVIGFGTLVSAWLGWLLSGAVVRPVRQLADAVDNLPIQPMRTALAAQLPRDELGRLGKAIDDYQARLVEAEDGERAFFADASHELRTPIAVVRGATELLLEDAADMPQFAPRLRRLDRGMQQLSELLDALLGLARRRTGHVETVDLDTWLAQCLAEFAPVRDGTLQLRLECARQRRQLAAREATLVLRGVIRRLVPATAHGTLAVSVRGDSLELRFHGDNDHATSTGVHVPDSSDRRLGMTLVGRLAAQIGWHVDDSDAGNQRVLIRMAQDGDFDARTA